MLRIKVCGITRESDAQFAAQLGADALGFIFYEKSPRYISPQQAAKIAAKIPETISRVAVCVKPEIEEIEAIRQKFQFDVLQVHGELSTAYLQKLRDYTVLPAISVGADFSPQQMARYRPFAQAVLFDTKKAGHYGGTGRPFNWHLLKNLPPAWRLVLAGGLNSQNIVSAVETVQPYAVDLNSGVENRPGIKDQNKLVKIFTLLEDKRGERNLPQSKNFPTS